MQGTTNILAKQMTTRGKKELLKSRAQEKKERKIERAKSRGTKRAHVTNMYLEMDAEMEVAVKVEKVCSEAASKLETDDSEEK